MDKGEKPIGYWLKEADKAITAAVNKHLEQYQLTRSHWQVLNSVYQNTEMTQESILQLLRNFMDESKLNEILDDFVSRKWMIAVKQLESGDTLIQMTEEGKAAFAEILSTQWQTRMRLFQGVTEEEYRTILKVLKQVVENASQ